MKILVYRWKAFGYQDTIEALENNGFEVDVIEQQLDSYDEDPVFSNRLKSILLKEEYRFVFTINYFGVISDVCQEIGVPYVAWTCDNPLISMYHESVFNQTNYIFTFDMSNYYEFKAMGIEHIYYMPLGVNVDRYDKLIDGAEDLDEYNNDICFVGGLYEKNSYDELEDVLPDYLRGYFDEAINLQADTYNRDVLEDSLTADILYELGQYYKLDKSDRSFSDIGLIFSTTVLGFKTANVSRINNLNALSRVGRVSLYSDSTSELLNDINYRGVVDYWTEMPKVFRQSKINLNMTIPNIKTGLPLRMWDILGSGGFLLSNYQLETEKIFIQGEDLVSYTSRADMIDKTKYFLEHDNERREIARNGYNKVKKYHSIQARVDEILELLEESGV